MKVSQKGIDLIKSFEGCKLQGYKCPAGVWTIGYGTTGSVDGKAITSSTCITQAKAEQLLRSDLARFEQHVMKYDSKYHWNQNEFDALVSFAYNIGNINQLTANGTRTKAQIAAKLPAYNKANGAILAGLTRRRNAEKTLFLTPVKGDDEMIENSKVIVNGKEIPVRRILKDGTNFIAIRDLANIFGAKVGAKGNIPVLTK